MPAQAWFGGSSGHRFRHILPLIPHSTVSAPERKPPSNITVITPIGDTPSNATEVPLLFTEPVKSTAMTAEDIICNAQIATCNLSCPNGQSPLANVCDAKTLKWACVCPPGKTKNDTMMPEWEMPIPVHQCSIGRSNCILDCGGASINGTTMTDAEKWHACVHQCSQTYQCGQKEQPLSKTRFDPLEDFLAKQKGGKIGSKKSLLAFSAPLEASDAKALTVAVLPVVMSLFVPILL